MATQRTAPIPSRRRWRSRIGSGGYFQKVLTFAVLNCFCSILVHAQFSQPLVFSSGGAVVLRSDQTGLLTSVNGSPFLAIGQNLTLDVKGRFLFSPGANSIRMFQITDATTGAYQEVPHSPFASPNTKDPAYIVVEPTGQFIAVVNLVGQNPGESLVETFKIDTSTPAQPALVSVPGSAVELLSTPVAGGVVQPPGALKFLIYMGPNPLSSNTVIASGEDFETVTVDPQSGNLLGITNVPTNSPGRAFAMDPQGRFVVIASGTQQDGAIELRPIVPNLKDVTFVLPSGFFPNALYVDSTGSFVYATYMPSNPPTVHIFAVDLTAGTFKETSSSPLPGATSIPQFDPDPTGPFQYGGDVQPNLIHGFTADPVTGYFKEVSGSPFTVAGAGSLTFSIPSGQQGTSGPSISLSASSLSFGSVTTNTMSAAQPITLTSDGAQPLAINSISIMGPDAAVFSETDTCHAPTTIQPKNFCSASVVFQPLTAGSKQAALSVTDNAPGSPHSVALSGLGVAPPPPAPAVAISPNPLTFPTITQGMKSSPSNISVTNSGNATLHISTVTVAGNNPADFSNSTAGCVAAALAPASSCSISVTFVPLAAGQRSETISLGDDASGSPQVIQVSGNANPAPVPAVSISPSPASFPATTQGTKSGPLNVVVTNSGSATLHISTVTVAGSNAADFSTSTGGCSAAAVAPNATCSISVVFAPLTVGQRSETITLADDASDSPQTLQVSGSANAAISLGAAPSGSTSASVAAGSTAQFNLQLTPGPGFTGNVSLACTGAPTGAACQAPSLTVTGSSPVAFTVSVTTSGPAHSRFIPGAPRVNRPYTFLGLPVLALLALILLFACGAKVFPRASLARRGLAASAVALMLSALLTAVGCGGGAAVQSVPNAPPPPVVTPQGAYTLTLTPSANSSSGAPLQLTPIQLTLNVT